MNERQPAESRRGRAWTLRRRLGLLAGPVVFLVVLLAPPPAELSLAGWRTAAVGLLMATWWLTEAIPIPATSLLPLVLLPVLGAGDIDEAASPYANPIIFLFMGGFLIALGMQRWNLHRRIALATLARVGSGPRGLVAGFMAATALLSMWVSNTATALMMLPIALSVVELLDRSDATVGDAAKKRRLSVALMLGIAYSASIGGVGTLIGTPPNALLAGFMSETFDVQLGFARWMLLGVPLVLVALPLVFLILTRVAFTLPPDPVPGAAELIASSRAEQGPIGRAERLVGAVFATVALLWMTRPLLDDRIPGLSDAGIAMAGGLALFLLPVDFGRGEFVLDWEWARRLPWGVLILFGGGLSLASAIDRTGLNEWIGAVAVGVAHWPFPAFLLLVTAFVVLLTELTSNTATAAAFLPILASIAVQSGWDPLAVVAPAAIGASCAFMLPVATPPNAIVYGSGRVTVPEMARAGVFLNLLMILLVTLTGLLLVPLVFGAS